MNFEEYKKNIEETINWLKKEYTSIRTGAASVAILDSVKVEAYGSQMPINQLASVGIEDAKTLSINPFDSSVLKNIEKSINDANLGVTLSVSGTTIRLSFPDLTSDRRKMLIKLAKEKLEDARVTLRKHRDEVKNQIEDSEFTDDEKYSFKEEMEKLTKQANEQLDEIFSKKDKEVAE